MSKSSSIAIVGMGCRFPGANSISEFWQLLQEGRSTISRFDKATLLEAHVPEIQMNDPQYLPYRGIINTQHSIANEEITLSTCLLLETVYQALEQANIPQESCPKQTAVYAGALENNCYKTTSPMATMDGIKDLTYTKAKAALIAYQLGLQGESVDLYTGCSTSLVAVGQAVKELLLHHADLAIVSSVAFENPQTTGYLYESGGILSADGVCRTFDKSASGSVISNGAATVILKRLDDAIHDENPILAVIAGCSSNNDGKLKPGFLAPGITGQYECIKAAWQRSGILPQELDYIEAHGSATQVGDPVEFYALNKAFQSQNLAMQQCGIGSVKTNIGHTTVVSGLAALIKTALMLKHRVMVPTLHFEQINPLIPIQDSPFYIATQLRPIDKLQRIVAGISNFGFGGTNAHVVLHSYERETN